LQVSGGHIIEARIAKYDALRILNVYASLANNDSQLSLEVHPRTNGGVHDGFSWANHTRGGFEEYSGPFRDLGSKFSRMVGVVQTDTHNLARASRREHL
jgi:hypothetical protein